ncbi:hypothetical protein LENED_012318 [Lentinula edodes]|uniref:Uncharacterized protein n=1 Tax=Lentinula edodes TaxID=5353 RepID=A0A1Q3ESD1_LENED|nr:hypothetical protein LENED_012318 [Lentinula edodes]
MLSLHFCFNSALFVPTSLQTPPQNIEFTLHVWKDSPIVQRIESMWFLSPVNHCQPEFSSGNVESSFPFFEKFRREILSSVEKVIACITSQNQTNDGDVKAEDAYTEETGQRMTTREHGNAVKSLTSEETNILKSAYEDLRLGKSSKSTGRESLIAPDAVW